MNAVFRFKRVTPFSRKHYFQFKLNTRHPTYQVRTILSDIVRRVAKKCGQNGRERKGCGEKVGKGRDILIRVGK